MNLLLGHKKFWARTLVCKFTPESQEGYVDSGWQGEVLSLGVYMRVWTCPLLKVKACSDLWYTSDSCSHVCDPVSMLCQNVVNAHICFNGTFTITAPNMGLWSPFGQSSVLETSVLTICIETPAKLLVNIHCRGIAPCLTHPGWAASKLQLPPGLKRVWHSGIWTLMS